MKDSIIIGLLQNTAILIAFAMIYQNIWIKNEYSKNILAKILTGLILSSIGIVIMYTPWTFVPGIVFDTRSVILSISGLFFGTIPTLILIFITGSVRAFIGGDGQWMGLAVIVSSGIVGILWRNFRPNWKNKNYFLELLAMGFVVHFIMLSCTLLLPPEKIIPTFKAIILPLFLIYTPTTAILGMMMLKQYNNWQNRNAKIKLDESERRMSKILESGNILTLILNKEGEISFCNDFLLKITGYNQDELIGKNWFNMLIPMDRRKESFGFFSEGIQNRNVEKQYENEILSKSGERLFISWYNIFLQGDSSEILGMASIGVDVSKSKLYEKQLEIKNREIELQNADYKQMNIELQKAKDKAEESDRLKTAFLANMSHEIRTPMNGILGFAELLKKTNISSQKQLEYVEIIEKAGLRMLNIINDIINISKIESGILDVQISVININDQIDYIYNFFKLEIEQKGLKFNSFKSLSASEALVSTDNEKLYAILTNLVKNSIKFTDKGFIEFGYVLKEEYLEFFIKDSGVGINEDKKEIIFDRFRQGSESLSRSYEGAGLGLSISKAYVEKLGGKIWVESKLNYGSIFYFTIPYKVE